MSTEYRAIRPSARFSVLLVLLDLLLAPSAQAGGCQDVYVHHDPCIVEGAAVQGTATTSALVLTIFNPDLQTHSWFMVPSGPADPSCSNPDPGDRWSSFVPFSGNVLAMTNSVVNISVGMDGTSLTAGSYREYGCFIYDIVGAHAVPIPIDFTVFPPPCMSQLADYSPCSISISLQSGATATTGLFLTLYNPTNESYTWLLAPTNASDPACTQAGTANYFSSFVPFTGIVASNTNVNVLVEVGLDSTGLPSTSHHEFACLMLSASGIDPVAIPVEVVITSGFFRSGFEQAD